MEIPLKQQKTHRIMISISDRNLKKLEEIRSEFGVSKTNQIESLIIKYLDKEYAK